MTLWTASLSAHVHWGAAVAAENNIVKMKKSTVGDGGLSSLLFLYIVASRRELAKYCEPNNEREASPHPKRDQSI